MYLRFSLRTASVLCLILVVRAIPLLDRESLFKSVNKPSLSALSNPTTSDYMMEANIEFDTLSVEKPEHVKTGKASYAQKVVEVMILTAWKELGLVPEGSGGKLPKLWYFPRQVLQTWTPEQTLTFKITRNGEFKKAVKRGTEAVGRCHDGCDATATLATGQNDRFDFEIELDVKGEDGKYQVFSKKGVKVDYKEEKIS
ncbi:hypothetical protein J3R30DRAFT_3706603 [Lentinula aciculospora]|uniref:Uncharacterized protein n=1 Tax=Lentinula aciculospora TaxID=153920 RepID=A0A9W9A5H2_9AGAR|nr:hypothetical protein J3R30DRAFT_3706603 [Lentinula aciculospora]